MKPEDDFLNWSAIFVASIAPGGFYAQMMNDMIRLMRTFEQDDGFKDPALAPFADHFLADTFCSSLEPILGLTGLSFAEKESVSEFLKAAAGLIAWQIPHLSSPQNIGSMVNVFEYRDVFYRTPGNEHYWDDVVRTLVAGCERFYKGDDVHIELSGYALMFAILHRVSLNRNNKLSLEIVDRFYGPLLRSFEKELDGVMERVKEKKDAIKQLDTDCFGYVYDAFLAMRIDVALEQRTTGVKLAELLFLCLQCQVLQKQFFGAKYVSRFVECSDSYSFVEPFVNEETVSQLVSAGFRPEVLTHLKLLFVRLFEKKLLDNEHVIALWETGKRYAVAQRTSHFDIMECLLGKMGTDERRNVVETMLKDGDECVYSFLRMISRQLVHDEDLVAAVADSLIEDCCQGKEGAKDALLWLGMQSLPQKLVQAITNGCFRLVGEGCGDFACDLFEKLMNVAASDSVLPVGEVFDKIEPLMKDHRKSIFRMLPCYLEKTEKPPMDILRKISEIEDDDLWILYKKLIQTVFAMKDQYMEFLANKAKNVKRENASVSLVEFMIEVWFVDNWKKIHAKSNNKSKKKSWLLSPVIKFEDLADVEFFEQAYFCSHDKLSAKAAGNFLLKIYKNVTTSHFAQVTASVEAMCRKHISAKIERERERMAMFLREFLCKVEANSYNSEDWGYRRFESLSDEVTLNIEVDQKTFVIHVYSSSQRLENIKTRISHHERAKLESIRFLGPLASRKDDPKLSDLGISKTGTIQCHISYVDSSWNGPETLPSIIFHNSHLASDLLKQIDNETDYVAAKMWKVLKLLPLDQDYVERVGDFKSYVDEITRSGTYRQRYMLIILSETLDDETMQKRFCDDGCHVVIAQLLDSNNILVSLEVLAILHRVGCFDGVDCAKLVSRVGILIRDCSVSSKMVLLCFKVMSDLYHTAADLVSDYITNHFDVFSGVLSQGREAIMDKLKTLVLSLCSSRQVYSICCKYWDKSPLYVQLFSEILSSLDDVPAEDIVLQYRKIVEDCSPYIAKVSTMLLDLMEERSDVRQKVNEIAPTLVAIALKESKSKIQKPLYSVLSTIMEDNEQSRMDIEQELKQVFDRHIPRWNYDPALFKKKSKMTGLRNLGATCFVNAILQQLFHVFPFRYLFMTTKLPQDSELIALQQLFVDIGYTERSSADPKGFLDNWHGWFGETLNPREQQDAGEFLQMLLDQLPENASFLFKGKLMNTLDGIEKPIHSSSTEQFWSLGVTVSGFTKLEDSMKELASDDVIHDYEVDKQKINVRKVTTVSEAPPVLFILLRRFDYQMQTGDRFKIDDYFEFPSKIDLKDVMDKQQPQTDTQYNLSGIVMHTGTAKRGHYFSFILVDGHWHKFDDGDVTICKESTVMSAAFGDKTTSAYILVYEKIGFHLTEPTNLSFSETFDFRDQLDMKRIEKENADFRLTQSLFQKATFDFVCNCQHLEVLLRYFVNVFCHSKLTENAKVIVNLIRDRMETGHNREYVLRYFISHVDAVVGDIANCVIGEALVIVESMITLIDLCFKDTTLADTSKNLCSLILKQIADLSDDCVHIKYFLMILRSFWQKYPSSQRELSEEWADGLMDFVEKAYGPERRPTYYQTIDLSVAFEILTVAVKNSFQMNAELLVRRSDRFVLSPHHIREFLILFVMLVRTNLIDVDSIIPLLNKITDENTLCDLMMFVISDCGKGDTITMINTMEQELPHFNTELLIKSLAVRCEDDSGYTLSQRVIEYTPDVMDHYLLASTPKIRLQCENLFKSLFPHYAAVPDMFCNSSSNCVRKKLDEFVPALAERLDCFVKLHLESSPCPGIVHNNEVIAKNPTIPQANQFTMCSVLRIWHFVCKGAELLTKDRFDLLLELIAITTKVDVWPNYQLICLLNFMLDFPSELVNSVALNQFTTIFQPVLDQEMCCQRFAPVLVCFVSRLDAIDENVASDILSSEQCNELVNQLLFENSNVPELRPIISRVAQCSKPRQKLIEALTNADDWLLTSMLRYWQMLNEAKPLTPKELTGVVNKCLSMFTHPRVTTQTTLEKENCETLKQYVSMVSDVSGPSDDEFWTDDLEIDWQSVLKALRNRPELEPNPVQLLMWCCEHNEVFASEFLENCDLILQHSDNLDIQKAMFKTFVSTATTNQSADSLVCLLKRLLAPLVENVALVSGNTELVLAAKYIRHYVEPNDDWVEPLFTYLISKPHIKVLQDLHESLITRLDVDGVWSIYDDLFTRIADTLKAGEPVPLELSRVFARLWTAKPGLRKQIVEKLGITSDNIALLNTCPGLVCELPDDVS